MIRPLTVSVFTDGSFLPVPGKSVGVGGWACHFGWHIDGRFRSCELVGCLPSVQSAEQMELLAIVKALEALDRPCMAVVYSDSQSIINALRGDISWFNCDVWPKWARNNNELMKRLMRQLRIHQVSFHWIKSHSKSQGNRRCDRLAGMSAKACMRRMVELQRIHVPVVSAEGYYCCRHFQCVGKHDRKCPNYQTVPAALVQENVSSQMPVWQL